MEEVIRSAENLDNPHMAAFMDLCSWYQQNAEEIPSKRNPPARGGCNGDGNPCTQTPSGSPNLSTIEAQIRQKSDL